MSGWSWAWLVWALGFFAIELPAAFLTHDQGNTLSEHVWAWTRGAGRAHWLARLGLVCGLAWLSLHLLSGGWV